MKKFMLLFSFLMVAGMMTAQSTSTEKKSCSKTCAKKCTKGKTAATKVVEAAPAETVSATRVASALNEADIAAESHEDISRKVCSQSGSVSYYKEVECPVSGKVSFEEVQYDSESKVFVNASPTEIMDEGKAVKSAAASKKVGKKKACSKSCAKTCSKKGKA